jgi:hypothetical protein
MLKDYRAAWEAKAPIISVENINDLVSAMKTLHDKGVYTSTYTLNSHGGSGCFSIGSEKVDRNTDFRKLRDGFMATTVFIGACNSADGESGSALIEHMAAQTQSTVIGACQKIPAGYKYDGSDRLAFHYDLTSRYPELNIDRYKISGNGAGVQLIDCVTIDKNKGLKYRIVNGIASNFSR